MRMSAPVIWLNEQNSSGVHLPALLRALPFPIHLHGTSRRLDDPTLAFCDSVAIEPDTDTPAEYATWLREHAADVGARVLLARRNLRIVADAAPALRQEAGCQTLLPPAAAVEAADDKAAFARLMAAHGIPVPLTFTVTSLESLEEALAGLAEAGAAGCLKPARGIGGRGFHLIAPRTPPTWSSLQRAKPAVPQVSVEDLRAVVTGTPADELTAAPLLVCEYLPGAMVSIDCWAVDGNPRSVIARRKHDNRQTPDHDPAIWKLVEQITAALALDSIYNVQLKENRHGQLCALEVNPRPSGGVQIAAAMGHNLLGDAVAHALDRPARGGAARRTVVLERVPIAPPDLAAAAR